MDQQNYTESSIKVLSDIEHIIVRPLMYISSERPMYQMFTEILDNSIDEAMNGHATKIKVNINYDTNVVQIEDNGRGLPQGNNKELNKPTPIVIYTKLNSGGKYDLQSYGKSGGLHGVGSVVVNALSKKLKVTTWRNEDLFLATFENGIEIEHNLSKDPSLNNSTGTIVEFEPNRKHKILTEDLRDYEAEIEDRLSLLVTIVENLSIEYNGVEVESRSFDTFVPDIKVKLFDHPIHIQMKDLMVSINWAEDNNRSGYKAFCNTLYNPNGGDQERGVYDALANTLGDRDVLLGLNFSVSVLYPGVEYDSQAKLKAVSKPMREYITKEVSEQLQTLFKRSPAIKEEILKLAKSKRQEIDKRRNKSSTRRDRKSSFLNSLGVDAFSDCKTKDRLDAELYIVEGNSAAGSAKQSRDNNTQAVLPLRGKIINAYTSDIPRLLQNREVGTLVSSIDAGIFDEVNVAKSRYGKIIIMCDADDDGKNIASLLIGLFTKAMPELIEKGYIYLALPPLYGTTIKGKFIPIQDEATRDEYVSKGHKITRFKGLGEMNSDQLGVACMDPTTRSLIQLTLSKDCVKRVSQVMGADSEMRKELFRGAGILFD